jgi:tripartite-type tricarboxylate transporter receptor subunit TctC
MCDGGTINSGAIRAYVIDAEQRSPILPNVPTSKEAGLPEFQVSAWNALFAPRGTPKAILDQLTDALDKALDDQNVRKRLVDLATEIPDRANRGQQSLAAYVKREVLPQTSKRSDPVSEAPAGTTTSEAPAGTTTAMPWAPP